MSDEIDKMIEKSNSTNQFVATSAYICASVIVIAGCLAVVTVIGALVYKLVEWIL
jgi:hypothetical protein